MRKTVILIFSTVILLTLYQCNGKPRKDSSEMAARPDTGTAILVFREYEHHFGKIKEGGKVSWQFIFENKGTGDLVLNSVTTTCGCTVPKYDVKPIPPGGNGRLEVVFDTSDRNGIQTKTISVRSNASVPVVLLKITAEVLRTSDFGLRTD